MPRLSIFWTCRNCFFELHLLGLVGIDHEERLRMPLVIPHQRPAAFHNDLAALPAELAQFTGPLTAGGSGGSRFEMPGALRDLEQIVKRAGESISALDHP
ncbi:MAG: hypothetical protein QM796_11175 [Chthoniobacteraceae bacterium]